MNSTASRSAGNPIAHSRPQLGAAEIRAVTRVVRSGHLAQGREVEQLEERMAERLNLRHAVAVSSGTAALHLALLALGVAPGRRVVAPSYVCVAVLNAIRYVHARERLVDCQRDGFSIDSAAAVRAADGAAAVIVPHLFGQQADLGLLLPTGVPIIEDCAMALGAVDRKGRPLGSRGRCSIFSFYATKMVAGGEGGLFATNDRSLADEVRDRRQYDKKDVWRLRFSYKMTDLQAALIRSQLPRLAANIAARRALACEYRRTLDPERYDLPRDDAGSAWFRFVVRSRVGFEKTNRHFSAASIAVARPVHRPIHTLLGLDPRRFPNTQNCFLTGISLPIYPDLRPRDLARIVAVANRLRLT